MFATHRLLIAALMSLQIISTQAVPVTTEYISAKAASRETYLNNALIAANNLNQRWFNTTSGLWDNMWWQSANFLAAHADLTELSPQRLEPTSTYYFETSVEQGRKWNNGNFANEFYDDSGWWAMALIRLYDVTGRQRYLDWARETFEDMMGGDGAACGGVWWSKAEDYVAAISNELFINTAAALGNRIPSRREHYRDLAIEKINWFLESGLINDDKTVADGIDISTCEPTGTVFTYNSGVILGALVELHTLTSNATFLTLAHSIARGAMTTLVDSDGILTETGWPDDLDPTRAMFKGVFVRNLKYLHAASPRGEYVVFLQKNADGLWERSRDGGLLGPNWQGRYHEAGPSSQGSGLDALVAAAAVSS